MLREKADTAKRRYEELEATSEAGVSHSGGKTVNYTLADGTVVPAPNLECSDTAIFLRFLLAGVGELISETLDENVWRLFNPRFAIGGKSRECRQQRKDRQQAQSDRPHPKLRSCRVLNAKATHR